LQGVEGRAAGTGRQSRYRRPRLSAVLAAVALVAIAVWWARRPLLVGAARILVTEDALGPVDMIVVSNASARSGALEAARLYADGISAQLAIATWVSDAVDDEIRRLGVPLLSPTDLIESVLEHKGVPPEAIAVIPDPVDGTGPEITAVAVFARQRRPESLLFITARSHTARARWLLRHELPPGVRFAVRSPRTDAFSPESWWQSRDQSREVAVEYLRWANTLVLHDPWGRVRHPGGEDPATISLQAQQ
jgi:uncharacterized SAM-binding protein YcdF (DUF218 family)